jgi:hypothetical protein
VPPELPGEGTDVPTENPSKAITTWSSSTQHKT